MAPASPQKLRLRKALAYLSLTTLTVTFIYVAFKFLTTSPFEGLADISFNGLTNESIKGQVDFSRSLFQVGLLLIGALWALVIGKKDEASIVLSDRPEIVMFVCASCMLVLSLVCHSVYLRYIWYIYEIAGRNYHQNSPQMPDAFDPNINNWYLYQIVFLLSGFVAAIFTLVSAHKLKEV